MTASLKKIAAVGAAFVAIALMGAAPAPPAKTNVEIAIAALSGRVLTAYELLKIYSDRTWHWSDGAIYFRPDRRFEAWLKHGVETSYGEGSWSVANNGQLCIRANWHSLSGTTKSFTCYVHRTSDAFYQRALPRGTWYLFSHIPPKSGDEITKLERGDHVSAEYLRARQYVIKNQRSRHRSVPKPAKPGPR